MRHFFIFFALVIPTIGNAGGGKEVGNGGDVIVCYANQAKKKIKSIQLLDLHEAKHRKLVVDFGPSPSDTQSILANLIARFEKFNPVRARRYQSFAEDFFKEAQILSGVRLVDVDDSLHESIPDGCAIEQIVIQHKPNRANNYKRYTIDQRLWDALDSQNKAALILHEVILRERIAAQTVNTQLVRQAVRDTVAFSWRNYSPLKYLRLARALEFPDFEFNGFNLSLCLSGNPAYQTAGCSRRFLPYFERTPSEERSADGKIYLSRATLTPSNAPWLIEDRSQIDFPEDSQQVSMPLEGIMLTKFQSEGLREVSLGQGPLSQKFAIAGPIEFDPWGFPIKVHTVDRSVKDSKGQNDDPLVYSDEELERLPRILLTDQSRSMNYSYYPLGNDPQLFEYENKDTNPQLKALSFFSSGGRNEMGAPRGFHVRKLIQFEPLFSNEVIIKESDVNFKPTTLQHQVCGSEFPVTLNQNGGLESCRTGLDGARILLLGQYSLKVRGEIRFNSLGQFVSADNYEEILIRNVLNETDFVANSIEIKDGFMFVTAKEQTELLFGASPVVFPAGSRIKMSLDENAPVAMEFNTTPFTLASLKAKMRIGKKEVWVYSAQLSSSTPRYLERVRIAEDVTLKQESGAEIAYKARDQLLLDPEGCVLNDPTGQRAERPSKP